MQRDQGAVTEQTIEGAEEGKKKTREYGWCTATRDGKNESRPGLSESRADSLRHFDHVRGPSFGFCL